MAWFHRAKRRGVTGSVRALVVELGRMYRIAMVDVLKISMCMQEISEHRLEVVVRWCRGERWLPRLACCVAMVVVCLGTSDADHGVQVEGFSWC